MNEFNVEAEELLPDSTQLIEAFFATLTKAELVLMARAILDEHGHRMPEERRILWEAGILKVKRELGDCNLIQPQSQERH